jgi:hypothetical protein
MISHLLPVAFATVALNLLLNSFHRRFVAFTQFDVTVNTMNVDVQDVDNEFQSILSLGFRSNSSLPWSTFWTAFLRRRKNESDEADGHCQTRNHQLWLISFIFKRLEVCTAVSRPEKLVLKALSCNDHNDELELFSFAGTRSDRPDAMKC